MKNSIYFLIISFSLMACGGSGDDTPAPIPQPINNNPTKPINSSPVNSQLCIDNTVTFEWNASTDSDGDAVSYELQVATSNQFSENLETLRNISTTSTQISLEKGVAYYWRVKAKDSKNGSSDYSDTFQFYTEGDGESNHLPFLPIIVSPSLNEIVQTTSTTLEWTASDVDNDELVFDVYFGKENPPTTKVSEDQSELMFSVDLITSTHYYWKIDVKESKANGGVTKGQVWSFKTD